VSQALSIREARPDDLPLVIRFVRELAAYERLSHEVVATPEDFGEALFGPKPKVFALILESGDEPVGFAVWFYNFSTFLGRHGIYIEDVYVRPEFRGRGLGRGVFEYLARKAIAEGCGRLQWWVLDWNRTALQFYGSLGAEAMEEWTVHRVAGDALKRLAGLDSPLGGGDGHSSARA
jgi:GNAT superfamily N-acetyltransferase